MLAKFFSKLIGNFVIYALIKVDEVIYYDILPINDIQYNLVFTRYIKINGIGCHILVQCFVPPK